MRLKQKTFLFILAVALLAVPAASAHVRLNPSEVPADSFSRFDIRVPNERPNAATTKVTVRLPKGLFFVSFQPKPGWKRTVKMEKLEPPVELFGTKLTERVVEVTWSGGTIAPGEFDEFGMSAKMPNAPGRRLAFPSLQVYSNGEVVRWIGQPDADEPAPRVTLGPKQVEGAAQPAASGPTVEAADDDNGRANLALGLGAGGLVAGLVALAVTLTGKRRRA